MDEARSQAKTSAVDIPSIEADMAFFEARLSFADHEPDTAYQRAQVKAYETLGRLMGETLARLRKRQAMAKQQQEQQQQQQQRKAS
jgi:hypothetical protein